VGKTENEGRKRRRDTRRVQFRVPSFALCLSLQPVQPRVKRLRGAPFFKLTHPEALCAKSFPAGMTIAISLLSAAISTVTYRGALHSQAQAEQPQLTSSHSLTPHALGNTGGKKKENKHTINST
jgi:hypothetical protein